MAASKDAIVDDVGRLWIESVLSPWPFSGQELSLVTVRSGRLFRALMQKSVSARGACGPIEWIGCIRWPPWAAKASTAYGNREVPSGWLDSSGGPEFRPRHCGDSWNASFRKDGQEGAAHAGGGLNRCSET